MAFEFKLPDVGEGIAEGEIVSWLIKEGDTVTEDQPVVEVMTDKATVEITSPKTGTILKLMGNEGDIIEVGAPLIIFGEAGESAPESVAEPAAAPAQEAAPAPAPAAPSGNGQSAAPATSAVAAPAPASGNGAAPAGRVLATPATRRLAREKGIDIKLVQGSGPSGRITNDDVTSFAEGGAPAATTASPTATPETIATTTAAPATRSAPAPTVITATESEERIPLRGVRKVISHHMEQARDHVAPFTYVDEIDVTDLVKLRNELKPQAQEQGVKLTYLPFIVKAVIAGLRNFPYLNASLDEASQEIVVKNHYNIGIAAATDAGLMVPVVKHADRRSMLGIANEITRLGMDAKDGKIGPDDLGGSTFTITSLGQLGGLFATPIVNYPELAIMGVHEIKKRPVVIDDQIVIRSMMLISLTFDHRIIDGHVGAAFANEVKRLLENPKALMIEAV